MLVPLLIGLAVVVAVMLIAAALRPSAYRVERNVEIASSAERVFALLSDLRQFAGVIVLFGDPFEKNDPAMSKTVTGSGVGQSYAWSGKKAGEGTMTIEELVPSQRVSVKLVFVKPMASTSQLALGIAQSSAGSRVTWSMAGNHNFLGRVFGLFMNMDKMLAADIEKSLAQLKTVAETTASAS